MLLRALIFRLAVHADHPRSSAEAFPGWPERPPWFGSRLTVM